MVNNQSDAEQLLLGQLENILDVLWCSENKMFLEELSMPSIEKETHGTEDKTASASAVKTSNQKPKETHGTEDKTASASAVKTSNQKPKETQPKESVYRSEKFFEPITSVDGDFLNLPKGQVLQRHRQWEKAVRPLKLKEDDKYEDVLDIKKTVDFMAETALNQVILKPKKSLEYTLNLLIDKDVSMEVFTELIEEFVTSVQHYGVFLSVHVFYIDNAYVYRDMGQKIKVENFFSFSKKKSLILVLSNCLSVSWKTNAMFLLLQELSKQSFCSIVQMLPSHLWLSTALGKGTQLTFKWGKTDKLLNSTLKGDYEEHFFEPNQNLFKIPVLAFEPSSFAVWSSFVSNDKRFQLSGMAFDNLDIEALTSYEFTEQERLDGFLENSTDDAKLLASYMANLPVGFDVARMIQEERLPQTNITHLSEVFLGGIIKRTLKEGEISYFFREVPRAYLKQFISPNEAYFLLETFVGRKGISSLNLRTFFANEKGLENMKIDKDTLELMRLAIDIKKRMGSIDYDQAVQKEIELDKKVIMTKVESIIPSSKRFIMGSNERDEEKPAHEVIINYDFEIAKAPVTVGEFKIFAEEKNYVTEAEKGEGAYVYDGEDWKEKKDASWKNPYFEQSDENPVVCVSWNDAQAYIAWLNEKTNATYSLPTEAEWEYTCRVGSTTQWSFGDDENELGKYAWYGKNGGVGTKPVGSKEANLWALHDMHGNVWEWCLDDYLTGYKDRFRDRSIYQKEKIGIKVFRGGSWVDSYKDTRSATRGSRDLAHCSNFCGFRLFRTLP